MRKIVIWISAIVVLLAAIGAGIYFIFPLGEEEKGYDLYYLNQEEDMLVPISEKAEEADPYSQIAELYLKQQSLPEGKKGEDLKLLLPDETEIVNYSLENGVLILDFSEDYANMSKEREILVRAGMVRLFSQIPDVKKIMFQIGGAPLLNPDGTEVGLMSPSLFVENSGKTINSYLKTTMKLYFTDKSGQRLLPEERSVYYNSNVPLERVVVEQLVKGPKEGEHSPTLPAELNILSVTIQEGICYVNLDDSFTTLLSLSASTLNPELAVYSIVNSIADACRVDKVQISVNGQTNIDVGSVNLGTLLTKRDDLVGTDERPVTELPGENDSQEEEK